MKLTVVLSVAGLLATGWVSTWTSQSAVDPGVCAVSTVSCGTDAGDPIVDPVAMTIATPAPVGTMSANKREFKRGDVVELQFSTPHAGYFAIRTPDGKFFYVIFPDDQAHDKLVPLVDSRRFATMRSLRLDTGKLTADPYIYGVDENKPVFTKSGTYTLIMGHNLHVDDERELTLLKVKYRHETAKKKLKKKLRRPAARPDVASL
jgi:hypothetical protein